LGSFLLDLDPSLATAFGPDRFPITMKTTVRNEGAERTVIAGIDTGMGELTPISKKLMKQLFITLSPMDPGKKPLFFHGQGLVTEILVEGTNCSLMGAPVQGLKALDITGEDLLLGTAYLGAVNATLKIDGATTTLTCSETPPAVDRKYVYHGNIGGRQSAVTVVIEKDGKVEKFKAMPDTGMGPGLTLKPIPAKRLANLGLAETTPEAVRWLEEGQGDKSFTAPKVSIEGVDGSASDVLVRTLDRDPWPSYDFEALVGYDFFRKAGTTMKFSKEGWSISLGREKGFLGVPKEAWAAGGVLAVGAALYAILD
jgi:hypothetical protein